MSSISFCSLAIACIACSLCCLLTCASCFACASYFCWWLVFSWFSCSSALNDCNEDASFVFYSWMLFNLWSCSSNRCSASCLSLCCCSKFSHICFCSSSYWLAILSIVAFRFVLICALMSRNWLSNCLFISYCIWSACCSFASAVLLSWVFVLMYCSSCYTLAFKSYNYAFMSCLFLPNLFLHVVISVLLILPT